MNKKSLLNLAMCSLLLGSMPMGLVGCKDYDGDIKDLNTTTGDLSSQISSLKTALETAQNAATAAANDAKAAADKADKATEEVALAKKAAEEAKAEAIAAAIAEVEKLQSQMSDMNAETAKELAALSGKIEGIEAGLSKIDLTKVDEMLGGLSTQIQEANKQISAINVQIAALENLKTEVPALKTSIDAITTELNAVKAKAEANTASINEIKGQLTEISGKISTEVTNAINTIAGILSQRLTSVTLMPEYYVQGIPSIVFESLDYTKQVKKEYKDGDRTRYYWEDADASKAENNFNIVGTSTQANYRLNPASIVAGDIDIEGMGFVSQVAQTRAGEDFNKVIAIDKAEVGANGVLTLNLKKVIDNINRPDQYDGRKFYTVSLKVPVAKKHLFENETEAAVYSEFARVKEVSGSAALVRLTNNGTVSLNDSTTAYTDNVNVLNVPYNSSLDLNTIIKASINVSGNYGIIDDLAAYGLSIKYAKAAEPYLIGQNKTDQQAYADIKGSTLTPIAASGSTDNKSIIGRQPIIRIMLVDDVNKNVVAVKYLKVKYVGDIAAVTLPEIAFESNPARPDDPQYVMPWDVFAKNVLEKLNDGQGMSKNDFQSIYWNNGDCYVEVPTNNDGSDKWSRPYFTEDWYVNESTGVIKWTMDSEYLGVLGFGNNDPRVYTATVTFKNSLGQYPDVIVPLKWTITPNVAKPQFAAFNSSLWAADNTLLVTVLPKSTGATEAKYDTDIISGRNEQNIFSNWEALTTTEMSADYSYYLVAQQYTEPNKAPRNVIYGELAGAGPNNSYSYNSLNGLKKISYTLDKTKADDRRIVCQGGTVVVDWYTNINGLGTPLASDAATLFNAKKFASFNLKVLPILSFNRATAKSITDNVVAAVTCDITGTYTITDAYNNVVAQGGTGDLWNFYGITSADFDGNNVKIATSATGAGEALPTGMTVSISNNKTLTYTNGTGAALPANRYLIVPVTIKHAWGTLTGTVAVEVKKGVNNN